MNSEKLIDMKIKATRTNATIEDSLLSKLTTIMRNVYMRVAIKSRYTVKEASVSSSDDLNVLNLILGDL